MFAGEVIIHQAVRSATGVGFGLCTGCGAEVSAVAAMVLLVIADAKKARHRLISMIDFIRFGFLVWFSGRWRYLMTRESFAGINSRLVDFSSEFWVAVALWVCSTASCETGEGNWKNIAALPITRMTAATKADRHRFFVVIGRMVFFGFESKKRAISAHPFIYNYSTLYIHLSSHKTPKNKAQLSS